MQIITTLLYFYQESSWLLSWYFASTISLFYILLCWHLLVFVGLSGFCNYLHCCNIIWSRNLICRHALLHLPPWPFVDTFQASRAMSVLLPLCLERFASSDGTSSVWPIICCNCCVERVLWYLHSPIYISCCLQPYSSDIHRGSFYMGMLIFDYAIHSQNGTCIFASSIDWFVCASSVKNNHRASILDSHESSALRPSRHASILFCVMCILHLMSLAFLWKTSHERHRH